MFQINLDFPPFQSEPSVPSDQQNSATKKNEIALAKVGLTIVLIFILCHSVKWIPNIYELVRLSSNDKRKWPSWIESTTHVAHFLMSLNSSVNFYVYCVKHFRIRCPTGSSNNTGAATQPLLSVGNTNTVVTTTPAVNNIHRKSSYMVAVNNCTNANGDASLNNFMTGTLV